MSTIKLFWAVTAISPLTEYLFNSLMDDFSFYGVHKA